MKNTRWLIAGVGCLALGAALVALPAKGGERDEPDHSARRVQEVIERRIAQDVHREIREAMRHAQEAAQRVQWQASWVTQDRIEHALKAAQEAQESGLSSVYIDVQGGWLGVTLEEVDSEKATQLRLPSPYGVLVTKVDEDSPAAKAGLKENDIITEFSGQRVQGTVQFRRLVRETPAGRTVPVTVWRDGRSQNLSVELGDASDRLHSTFRFLPNMRVEAWPQMTPPLEIFSLRTPTLGISAEDLSGQLADYFGVPGGEGVLVREVRSGTPADKAGLKAGDVITSVDGKSVESLNDLRSALRDKRDSKSVEVGIIRKGAKSTLTVEIEVPERRERRNLTFSTRI